jgi:hypothetical protein
VHVSIAGACSRYRVVSYLSRMFRQRQGKAGHVGLGRIQSVLCSFCCWGALPLPGVREQSCRLTSRGAPVASDIERVRHKELESWV